MENKWRSTELTCVNSPVCLCIVAVNEGFNPHMVKDLSRENIEHNLRRICLSVDDIIEIIEGMNFKIVTAKNKDIEFESLEDIKSHRELMAGEPVIYCDAVRISFSRTRSYVGVVWNRKDVDPSIVLSTYLNLKSRKTFIDYIGDVSLPITFSMLPLSLAYLMLGPNFGSTNPTSEPYISYLRTFASYAFIPLVIVCVTGWYTDMIRKPVYSRKRGGFLTRNFDNIMVATISAVIGAVGGSAATLFLTKALQ